MTVISFDLALLNRDIENLLGRLVSLDVEAHAMQKELKELQWFRERLADLNQHKMKASRHPRKKSRFILLRRDHIGNAGDT